VPGDSFDYRKILLILWIVIFLSGVMYAIGCVTNHYKDYAREYLCEFGGNDSLETRLVKIHIWLYNEPKNPCFNVTYSRYYNMTEID
jgi:hypothetical protein